MKKFKMTIMLMAGYVLLGVNKFLSCIKYDLFKCETPEQEAIRQMVEVKLLDHDLLSKSKTH